ncbi:hypothetical protein BDR03DRAFT_898754 [Suillus americanus]|nr:hypothetical protein BDR03DRAFT_898754 [Suillus americanus]
MCSAFGTLVSLNTNPEWFGVKAFRSMRQPNAITTHRQVLGEMLDGLESASQCPPEHKYKKPAPPIIDNSNLASYQSLMCTGSYMVLSDLLAVSNILSRNEHVRVSLLEVMIGRCMVSPVFSEEICGLEFVFDHNRLTDDQWSIACFLASFAFVPQIFGDDLVCYPELKRKEFTWIREDTVIYIATHLDDKRCLQASVSRLVNAITEQKDNPGDSFGIAFSVYHCAVVKVVKDSHTMSFSHTNALQFLPSIYTDSPSTPGITTLARLGYRNDPALFEHAMELCGYNRPMSMRIQPEESLRRGTNGGDDVPPNTICSPLPLELWKEIALHLHPFNLIAFSLVSTLCREAASMVLRYPHLCGYRLVAVPKKKPEYLQDQHLSLHTTSFSAARTGVPATVLVGCQFEYGQSRYLDFPLSITDLKPCSLPFSVILYVDGKLKSCWV